MADKNLLSQMLEHLVNDDQAKAEELFHEYVVAASREIYENLIESEISEEDDKEDDEMEEAAQDDDAEDDKVDEASEEDKDDEDLDENFEDVAFEAGADDMGGDATDDLEGDLEMGDEGEEGEQSEEEIMQDLESIVDELQAKFAQLKGEEEAQGEFGDEEGGDDMPEEEGFDLETVREYVEKVPAGHGAEKKGAAEKADNKKSTIDNMKNDMGGTTANILSSKEDAATYANQGQLKGSGLNKQKPTEDNAGNVNVPGGNAGKTGFKTKEAGHGAEKSGSKESADVKQSLFRGRR
jgi:hypothetical protein